MSYWVDGETTLLWTNKAWDRCAAGMNAECQQEVAPTQLIYIYI